MKGEKINRTKQNWR